MAFTQVTMQSPNLTKVKVAPIGFSWTVLFFYFFVPLFRRDWLMALVMFIFSVIGKNHRYLVYNFDIHYFYTMPHLVPPILATIVHIVFAFTYNKMYLRRLIKKGYHALDEKAKVQGLSAHLKIYIPIKKS